MANTRDIRRRIKSVKNTAQITKAMQMVASSKMKKAQDQATAGCAYSDLMNKVLVNLKEQCEPDVHPLFQDKEGGRTLMLLITSDKGLCGAFNTNLLRKALDHVESDTDFVTVGAKGRQTLVRLKKHLLADFHIKDPVAFLEVKTVAKYVTEAFLSGKYTKVRVAFTNFINTIKQEPMVETLLPISPIELGKDKSFVGMGAGTFEPKSAEVNPTGYLFEPSVTGVLDTVVPQYVNNQVYQMIMESRASEHSARMVAMKNATDNAKQLIKDLTLEYNKVRQAGITNELLEITTAMRALQ
ncbi:MAG: ATP synthase F1 subunit gamma [Verrucomicrobiales bacterium]|nr:ATP synthase F1 subunit gamma [Verrucomicrobiae bacterium]MCP5554382.1 ATP synthase F1 subunit gamma [Akkermansiaceae bacterium]